MLIEYLDYIQSIYTEHSYTDKIRFYKISAINTLSQWRSQKLVKGGVII